MALLSDPISSVFAALAHPMRRDMLERLRAAPLTVGELAANYDVSGPAISQHLKVLERAGLIQREVDRQWRTCSIDERGLDDAAAWIAQQRADWTTRFDLLDQHLRTKRGNQP